MDNLEEVFQHLLYRLKWQRLPSAALGATLLLVQSDDSEGGRREELELKKICRYILAERTSVTLVKGSVAAVLHEIHDHDQQLRGFGGPRTAPDCPDTLLLLAPPNPPRDTAGIGVRGAECWGQRP